MLAGVCQAPHEQDGVGLDIPDQEQEWMVKTNRVAFGRHGGHPDDHSSRRGCFRALFVHIHVGFMQQVRNVKALRVSSMPEKSAIPGVKASVMPSVFIASLKPERAFEL